MGSHEMVSTILSLDLGTKTGWVLSETTDLGDINLKWGNEDFAIPRFHGGGMRYLHFYQWLNNILYSQTPKKIDEVYFEEVVAHSGTAPAHVYGGFLSLLTMWCEKNCIPYQGVPVGTIKKYVTGKGNANKQMVIDAIKMRGYDVEDDNEADALALTLYIRKL